MTCATIGTVFGEQTTHKPRAARQPPPARSAQNHKIPPAKIFFARFSRAILHLHARALRARPSRRAAHSVRIEGAHNAHALRLTRGRPTRSAYVRKTRLPHFLFVLRICFGFRASDFGFDLPFIPKSFEIRFALRLRFAQLPLPQLLGRPLAQPAPTQTRGNNGGLAGEFEGVRGEIEGNRGNSRNDAKG
jgi:hypothetical protein